MVTVTITNSVLFPFLEGTGREGITLSCLVNIDMSHHMIWLFIGDNGGYPKCFISLSAPIKREVTDVLRPKQKLCFLFITPCSELKQHLKLERDQQFQDKQAHTVKTLNLALNTYLTLDADSRAEIGGGSYKIFIKLNSLMLIRLSLFKFLNSVKQHANKGHT